MWTGSWAIQGVSNASRSARLWNAKQTVEQIKIKGSGLARLACCPHMPGAAVTVNHGHAASMLRLTTTTTPTPTLPSPLTAINLCGTVTATLSLSNLDTHTQGEVQTVFGAASEDPEARRLTTLCTSQSALILFTVIAVEHQEVSQWFMRLGLLGHAGEFHCIFITISLAWLNMNICLYKAVARDGKVTDGGT